MIIIVYYHEDWTADRWTSIGENAYKTEEEALAEIKLAGYTLTDDGEHYLEGSEFGEFAVLQSVSLKG